MSVKFMILGAPRSGTTWAANWLIAEGEACVHDPFMLGASPAALDAAGAGISCTSAVIQHPDWVFTHPAPKVILHRDFWEINNSLSRLGLPQLSDVKMWERALYAVPGLHVDWNALFRPHGAAAICRYLTGHSPLMSRYLQLRDMNVQPSADIIRTCQIAARAAR